MASLRQKHPGRANELLKTMHLLARVYISTEEKDDYAHVNLVYPGEESLEEEQKRAKNWATYPESDHVLGVYMPAYGRGKEINLLIQLTKDSIPLREALCIIADEAFKLGRKFERKKLKAEKKPKS